ncbi:SMI1/KNR4 family protein [Aciduricibacillus chroicocephali]|uniref:SMI1/KNR4 family protein n=1 Tax=Aciduricibacillus chroicocephali TaxID=3054939 RepID=A0ABY9KSF5_9BACI|nr:SMI1/KNR4 family protein [Bacillaceae bacterium 44XB]
MHDYIFDTDMDIDHETLEELTDDTLIQVEKKLRVKLPESYVSLMRVKNGGTLAYRVLHSEKLPDDEMLVESIMGIDLEDGIGKSPYLTEEWEIDKDFVLFAGDGHEWLAFDYRNYDGDNPAIFYISDNSGKPKKMADNFQKFLKLLKEPEELDDDDFEDDFDDEFDRVYTKKELEDYIEEGEDLFYISAGLEQFAKEKGDIDWFVGQCLKTVDILDIDEISRTVGEVVLIKLKIEPAVNWPIKDLEEIVEKIMVSLDFEGEPDTIAQRLGKRIQRKLDNVVKA